MAKGCRSNTYEEARKQRLEENRKRFEDLGISKISKNLTEITSSGKKTRQHLPKVKSKSNGVVELRRSSRARNTVSSYRDDQHLPKVKSKSNGVVELRRSSRARNTVSSYRDDVDTGLIPHMRKRSRSNSSSWGSYVARPLEELKEATEEERMCAFRAAEVLQSNLQSSNPSFVKSMVRSHVYSCFWLSLPSRFCEEHLPKAVCDMVLEDENGSEYDAVFIGKRTGLSGGWRAFALEHKLDDGDALVFELVEPTRFKIYIIKAFPDSVEEDTDENLEEGGDISASKTPKKAAKKHESQGNMAQKLKEDNAYDSNDSTCSHENLPEIDIQNDVKPQARKSAKKINFSQKKLRKECKLPAAVDSEKEEQIEGNTCATDMSTDHKSQANKTRKAKRDTVKEIGNSESIQQLQESNADGEIKPQGARPEQNRFVQNAGNELKKTKPDEEAGKNTSQRGRKKFAPKLFRKKA